MPGDDTKNIASGRKQYLVAPRRTTGVLSALGVAPMSAGSFQGLRKTLEGFGAEIVSVKGRPRNIALMGASSAVAEGAYVVRMDDEAALALQTMKPPNLLIEEDAFMSYAGSPPQLLQPVLAMQSTLRTTEGMTMQDVRILVVGDGGTPLRNAHVILDSIAFPSEGRTDENGLVVLRAATLPGAVARSLFAEVEGDYWSFYTRSPAIDPEQVNVVRLTSLRSTVRGFPAEYHYGWGQLQMGLDQVPAELTGRGVKVAIIDSGADNKHPHLRHIQKGHDYVAAGNAAESWTTDVVGHGTHCAGVIAAQGSNMSAFRGFAPEAEIHVLRIFPGGRFSGLLDALDYCIENEIDLVNMSLGSDQVSEVVEQKLAEVVNAGIACIVAAGNSGGAVQYPAASPNAFAVAAMGKVSEILQRTWDAETLNPSLLSLDGFFSPTFSCYGPQVKACAPGVAIISTVPGGAFEPESGTSMAAPHVTGLATLVMAHHPAMMGIPRGRDRVARLFEVIRSACVPLALGPARSGFGLPVLHGLLPAMKAALPRIIAPGAVPSPMEAGPTFRAAALASDLSGQIASVIANAVAQAISTLPQQVGSMAQNSKPTTKARPNS